MANNSLLKVLAVGALVFGCAPPQVTSTSSPKTAKHYDAMTVFQGVYFDEGAAADTVKSWNLPRRDAPTAKLKSTQPAIAAEQLRDLASKYDKANLKTTATNLRSFAAKVETMKTLPTSVTTKQKAASSKLLMARIKKADPTFFARFGKNIRSGSHTKVQSILNEGLARITAAATELPASASAKNGITGTHDSFAAFAEDDGGGDVGGGDIGGADFGGGDGAEFPADNGGNDFPADNAGNDFPADNGGNDFPADNGGNDFPADNGGNDNAGNDNAGNDNAGNDNAGNDNASNDNAGNDNAGNDNAGNENSPSVGDQASLAINMTVAFDTAVALVNVVAGFNTLTFSNSEGGGIATASFVAHLTDTFDESETH